MPKDSKPVPRPLTKPKLATKSTRVSPTESSPPSLDQSSPAPGSPQKAGTPAAPAATEAPDPPGAGGILPITAALDKDLVLRIILAKLEASKTCDWCELSLKLAEEGDHSPSKTAGKAGGKGKGKGQGQEKLGKKGRKSEEALSGAELFDLYHNRILPALKAGRPLWREDGPRQVSGSSTGSAAAASDSAQAMGAPREEGKGKAGGRAQRTSAGKASLMEGSGSEVDGLDMESEGDWASWSM